MRLWLLLCVSVLWDSASLHPTRELGNDQPKECCPCPKDASGRSLAPPAFDQGDMTAAGSSSDAVRAVGGCPCQRDADSTGASSMFFPSSAARAVTDAVRPFFSFEDAKENPDPILHPETKLASSVLETLRQATDEEYRDAVARDAERSAIPIASDEIAAESGTNLVTVVVNPKNAISDDDAMGEASHAHESRCVHPLGRSSLRSSAYKPQLRLTDFLNLPQKQSWNLFDMDSGVGASNVNERIVAPSFKENDEVNSKIPSKLSFTNSNKPISSFYLNDNHERSGKEFATISDPVKPKKIELPNLSKLIPRLNTPNLLRRTDDHAISSNSDHLDSQNAASIFKERYSGFERMEEGRDNIKTISDKIKNGFTINTKPLQLNSNTTPQKGRDAAGDFLNGILKGLEIPRLNNLLPSDIFNTRNNDKPSRFIEQKEKEVSPNNKPFVTEIIDAVSSPSEIKSDHVSIEDLKREGSVGKKNNTDDVFAQKIIDSNPMKTEILDSLPKSSDDEMFVENDSNETSRLDFNEKQLNSDGFENSAINEMPNGFAKDGNSELNNEMEQFNNNLNDETIDDTLNDARNIENSLEIPNDANDSDSDASSNVLNIDSSQTELDSNEDTETVKDDPVVVEEEESFANADKNSKDVSRTNPIMPLRERIRNTLDFLRKPTEAAPSASKFDSFEDVSMEPSNFDRQTGGLAKTNSDISDDGESKLDINDLQQMSDSLLDMEKKRNESKFENNDPAHNINPDIEGEISPIEDLENESKEAGDFRISDNAVEENKSNPAVNASDNPKDACIIEAPAKSNVLQDVHPEMDISGNEMKSEASEPVFKAVKPDTNLRSTLRQAILQPTSLSDLTLPTLDLKDVFSINPLAASNIFNAREGDDDFPSTGDDNVDHLSINQELMSPSTSSFRSALPPLKTLEDINLDLLQLNPLSSRAPTLPRLNLNSFKSRLALPETMQLKPVILDSSVGSKKGVVGATLSSGTKKNKIDSSNMLQQASLKTPNILGRPLETLPSLDDLRDTMLENAQNLLSTPLETTSRNAVEDTLRSGQVLTENLRVEAENAVKDIQRNLQSSFKEVGLGNQGLSLGSSLKSPNDLLDEISRRHDDVNDKLKGIQYDFNDRIESLRSNILDEYRKPVLGSSLDFNDRLKGIETDLNDHLETLRSNIFDEYRIPSFGNSIFDRVPSLGSSMSRQSSLLPKPKPSGSNKRNKITLGYNSDKKRKFSSGRASLNKNEFKMPTASSSAITKTIESPKRRVESPVLKTLQRGSTLRNPPVSPRERPSLGFLTKKNSGSETGKSLFKTPTFPSLKKSKVKISFSTTTPMPSLQKKTIPALKELRRTKPLSIKETLPSPRSSSRDRIGSKLKSLRDSNAFASEPVPTKVSPPASERKSIKDALRMSVPKVVESYNSNAITTTTTMRPLIITRSKPVNKFTPKTTFDIARESEDKIPKFSGTVEQERSLPFKSQSAKLAPLAWPRSIDNDFLSKVRGALSARLAGLGQNLKPSPTSRLSELLKTSENVKSSHVPADMERSASNNIDVALSGPEAMKENTPYSCKMMCTKKT